MAPLPIITNQAQQQPHRNQRRRSSLLETEEPHRKVVSTVSPRSGKSPCLSENGGWHPGWGDKGTLHPVWVLCFDLSSASLSVTRRGHTTDFEEGGAPVWMELDGTLSGLSLSTYSSSSPPEQLPRKLEGGVSFCSSAARLFRFRALELGILMPLTEEVAAQPVGIRTVPSRFRLNTR